MKCAFLCFQAENERLCILVSLGLLFFALQSQSSLFKNEQKEQKPKQTLELAFKEYFQ